MIDLIEIFVFLIFVYLIVLCLLRIKYYKSRLQNKVYSNCCPICNKPLDSHKRKRYDKQINTLTLNIFGFKRFYCKNCKWTGLLAKYTKKIK